MKFPVSVEPRKRLNHRQKWILKTYGLSWDGLEYVGIVNEKQHKNLSKFCKRASLKLSINNKLSIRSGDYRREFFKNNLPVFGRFYFCSYCGRPVSKERITIDHLYPIGRAKTDPKFQKKLIHKGYENINDVSNLVPACFSCNKRKGTKTGKWILKGKIGRYQHLWFIRHALRIIIIGLIVWLLFINKDSRYVKYASECLKGVIKWVQRLIYSYSQF